MESARHRPPGAANRRAWRPAAAPADAVVLFDGKDLSKWAQRGPNGESVDPKWPVRDGYFKTGAKSGSMYTRDSFGDASCTSNGQRRRW